MLKRIENVAPGKQEEYLLFPRRNLFVSFVRGELNKISKASYFLKWISNRNLWYFFSVQGISTLDDEVIRFSDENDKLVWFLQPQEAQLFLASDSEHKMFNRTSLPFVPRKLSRKYSRAEMIRRRTANGLLIERAMQQGMVY